MMFSPGEMWTAIKCAYLGWLFHGSQIQPGVNTVEGDLTDSLSKLGYAIRVRLASRTDRGVSALGNVFVLPGRERRFRAINAFLSGVFCHAWADVPEGFKPRHASSRWYRYLLPERMIKDVDVFEDAVTLFEGVHDFSGFTREKNRNTRIRIDSVSTTRRCGLIIVDIRAERFLMHQVRFMVSAAVRASESGSCNEVEVCLAEGRHPENLAPADPHGLILMDVEYAGVEFTTIPLTSRRLKTLIRSSLLCAVTEYEIFSRLME